MSRGRHEADPANPAPFMKYLTVFLLFAWISTTWAQQKPTIYEEPLSERRVSYDMQVQLEPESRNLSGLQRITWRNPGQVPVNELQFHLYLNAFKPGSTFMNESGGSHRGFEAETDDQWGGINITRMRIADHDPPLHGDLTTLPPLTPTTEGTDLTENISFIRPDDNNPNDYTVISVPLPESVQPGETIALDVEFDAKMPEIIARTGWKKKADGSDFFLVAQWFPKLGVYEVPGQRYVPADAPEGQWNTHQFHANSEFYADYGTYRVQMTVPEDYIVGGTGVRTDAATADGKKTLTYWAEDVHDFAWTASNAYEEFTDEWRHVKLRLLIQPEHAYQAQRHFDAAKMSLQYFDDWYGEYPYSTLTLIDGVGGSNGMEYPTMITCGTVYMLPEWARPLELVTLHEFGHQYWYGLLGSNEFEEAWLDEGINSYTEQRIMDAAYGYGSAINAPGFPINDSDFQRLGYTKSNPNRGAMYTRSWEYDFGDYSKCSYPKPATVLATLENYLGADTMSELMRTYYSRWRFRHPTTRDFIQVAEDVSGQDLSWFFDQYVYGTVAVDYAVNRIRRNRISGSADDGDAVYENSIRVQRKQQGIFPQTLLVRFEDGTEERLTWSGEEEWKDFTFERSARAVEAFLDPENKVKLDINRLNNRQTLEPDNSTPRKYSFKFMVWVQQFFYLVASLA